MARPLPRYLRHEQREADAALAAILLETGEALPEDVRGKPLRTSADGHDPQRLRGLPAIGRNVSGAIRGSDPLGEVLRREARQRRR